MIGASRSPAIRPRVDRRRRGFVHVVQIVAGAERRHWIFALPWALVYIACRIELALNIARLAGYTHFVLHDVVVLFQFVVTDWPVLQRRSLRKHIRAVTFDGFR